jgi:hypothetical protein
MIYDLLFICCDWIAGLGWNKIVEEQNKETNDVSKAHFIQLFSEIVSSSSSSET